jgi:hypothetical protein
VTDPHFCISDHGPWQSITRDKVGELVSPCHYLDRCIFTEQSIEIHISHMLLSSSHEGGAAREGARWDPRGGAELEPRRPDIALPVLAGERILTKIPRPVKRKEAHKGHFQMEQ